MITVLFISRKHHKRSKKTAATDAASEGQISIVSYPLDDEIETPEPMVGPSLPDFKQPIGPSPDSHPLKQEVVPSLKDQKHSTETSIIGPTMPSAMSGSSNLENGVGGGMKGSLADGNSTKSVPEDPSSLAKDQETGEKTKTRSEAVKEEDLINDELIEKMLEEPVFVKYEFVNRKFEPVEGEEQTCLEGDNDDELEMNHPSGVLQFDAGHKRKAVDSLDTEMPSKKTKIR